MPPPRLRGEVMAHKLEIARRKTALAGCRAIERYRAVTAERSRGYIFSISFIFEFL